MMRDRDRWNRRYREKAGEPAQAAAPFLKKALPLLPRGTALDLASGEGRNAVLLAQAGFDVTAVDISGVALRRCRALAAESGVKVRTKIADLSEVEIPRESYDLIVDFYFLDRRLVPRIRKGLKRGGRVVFETYTTEHPALATGGPSNPRFLLKPNELLRLFEGFRVLLYREGVFREGGARKALASLVAEKRM